MPAEIKIKEITNMAMSETFGLELRKRIQDSLNESDMVIIDFENISLFATPFFNASVGYLYMNLTPEVYKKRIFTRNLNELGDETYRHSLENAEIIYKQKRDTDKIGRIVEDTINNS